MPANNISSEKLLHTQLIPIRWSDLDAYNIVHHYIIYAEAKIKLICVDQKTNKVVLMPEIFKAYLENKLITDSSKIE